MKRFVFRNYAFITLIVLTIGVAGVLIMQFPEGLAVLGGLTAGLVSFCYFVQQQRLAETQLFKELFTEFNRRYDGMNEDLASIRAGLRPQRDSSQVIIDYLNLCAEEYLFYRQGYILPEVWRSWCRGMQHFLKHESFKPIWDAEQQTESYYGLSDDAINNGARGPA